MPPSPQEKAQVASVSQVALGQIEPPAVQVKLQLDPALQVTARSLQLPELLHSKVQVWPASHVAWPLQIEPPPSHLEIDGHDWLVVLVCTKIGPVPRSVPVGPTWRA